MYRPTLRLTCALLLAIAIPATAQAGSTPQVQSPPTESAPPEAPQAAQPAAPVQAGNGRVRVYLDCFGGGQNSCFPEYLRDEIDFVDFVRQPQDADVHLLASGAETGGGGRELVLRFVGRGRFAGHDHDLKAITGIGDTENTRREVVLRTVLVGLLDYVAHDGIPPGVNLTVATEGQQRVVTPIVDPWNLWVFSVRASGSFDANERNRERQWQTNFSADRVTADWKMSFGGRVNQVVERFDLDEDDPFEVTRRDRNVNGFVAKSYGPHWSFGARGRVGASTFGNTKFSADLAPAVEFSVFPYEQYATRQLTMQYSAGAERVEYNEITIFQKLEETLWQHRLSSTLDQRQPWGSLRAGFEFSQYLHDGSKYRLQGSGNVNLRITRGLSLNLSGSASRIRDQLSLPLRDATDEEVLLRIRQLQSGYEVFFNFGVTYSFGSLFNNVVNPRFGN
jgi:hypothetical protein